MKLIVQIPCYNEEDTLPLVLRSIPREIKGIDKIEIMIIDDGSSDKTVEIAKKHGVDHFVIHRRNMGLARSFKDGVNKALELNADILVNTDGDNQYPQERISDLVQPIVNGQAEIVIADRQTSKIAHFSPLKKLLQRFGSWVVNKAAGTNLPDAASGFRAYSRHSLERLNVITSFSYCMETIIQAGNKRLAIASVPIETNPKLRESRLFKNIWHHVFRSMSAIVQAYLMYKPRVIFVWLTSLFFLAGLVPFVRYFIFYLNGTDGNHIQSIIVGAVLLIASFLSMVLGIVAHLTHINRILLEDNLEYFKKNLGGKTGSNAEK